MCARSVELIPISLGHPSASGVSPSAQTEIFLVERFYTLDDYLYDTTMTLVQCQSLAELVLTATVGLSK